MENVILTEREILRYNAALLRAPGRAARLYDLRDFLRPLTREEVGTYIRQAMPVEGECCCGARRFGAAEWARLAENCALDALAPWVEARWGLCVHRSSLRALPTALALTKRPDDRYDDLLQCSAVLPNEPLALLHTSADGHFFFAATAFYMGWVAAEDVGLCGFDAATHAADGDFLLVTGSRVTLCEEPYEPRVSRRTLTMGTRLRLAAPPGTVRALRGRMSYDAYLVQLPVRGADGRAETVEALVPLSADVRVGYLPYTSEDVAAQAEKLRGEVYGWGGMLGARDCSALVGEVYRCFGFRLPRDAAGLALLPGAEDIAALPTEEKRDRLCALPRGTLLYFPGHVMLSFGAADGEPLCLSAAGTFLPPGSAGGTPRAVNSVAVTPMSVVRANGRTWLESLTKIIHIP